MIKMNHLLWASVSDKGEFREKNQDRVFCREVNTSVGKVLLACVCDGVGSFANSERASELVVQGLKLWMEGLSKKRMVYKSENELLEDLTNTITELNLLIYEKQRKEHDRLGCTMSLILIIDKQYHVIHIGDSRIYYGETAFEQITVDDVSISETDGKKRLKKCVGLKPEIETFRYSGTLKPHSIFFLGSDGAFNLQELSSYIEYINNASDSEHLEDVCRSIIKGARGLGETDNISCIIIRNQKKNYRDEIKKIWEKFWKISRKNKI